MGIREDLRKRWERFKRAQGQVTPEPKPNRFRIEPTSKKRLNGRRTPTGGGSSEVTVSIKYKGRYAEHANRLTVTPTSWVHKAGRKVCEVWVGSSGINFLVHFEKFSDLDATRVTVTLVNSVKGAGAFYYKSMLIKANGRTLLDDKRGVVLPGGIMPSRAYLGKDSDKLSEYGHLRFPNKEDWIDQKCKEGIESWQSKVVGPWTLGWSSTTGNSSLDGSHGGAGVAPLQGGPNCWTKGNPSAYRLKELEMITVARRSPIAKTDSKGKFVIDPQAGWMGRTWEHEKEGWKYSPALSGATSHTNQDTNGKSYLIDDNGNFKKEIKVINGTEYLVNVEIPSEWYWCDYEEELFNYRAIDHTHLHREIRAAAMLADQDEFAAWFLRACWNDAANWLGSDGGKPGELRNLAERIRDIDDPDHHDQPHQGVDWGGRGWSHLIRCFLYAAPYLTLEESRVPDSLKEMCRDKGIPSVWFDALKFTTSYIANKNGICQRKPGDYFPGLEHLPVARGREVDLMGVNFRPLGLMELEAAWVAFCKPLNGESMAESFEVTDKRHWSQGAYHNPSYFPGYDGFRGLFTEFGSAEETEVHAKMRDIIENPWDYTIRPKRGL